ncbi:MAG: hypothetical protein PVF58_16635 [Candidatus Methanofastidiosia archaeon]|jgi:hypothetical protein
MTQKTVYFVSKEKKVNHIGFFSEGKIHFVDSPERLSEHGFTKDPAFFRETDTAVYVFSSLLPESMINQWFSQILSERDHITNPATKQSVPQPLASVNIKKPPKSVITPPERTVLQPERGYTPRKIKIPPKSPPPPATVKRSPRKKNIETLKEEIKAQRIWDSCVPTCGECSFWEKRVLPYTQTETGECTLTGNFVEFKKKACSEFQK